MDLNFADILKEGTSFWVLLVIIWYVILKAIPNAIKDFRETLKEQNESHREEMKEQNETYKNSLDRIAGNFTTYMERSIHWHDRHTEHLTRVEWKVDNILKK